jgi:hypothetical protein
MTTNLEQMTFAAGLRNLATMYETHPGLPVPGWPWFFVYSASPQQLVEIAKAPGAVETKKSYEGEQFNLQKIFEGNVGIQYSISREQVCRKVVKEVVEVPATIVPAHVVPEKVIPAHSEEIVEWECDPLLAPPTPKQIGGAVAEEEFAL